MFVNGRFVQVVSSKGRTHALDTIPHTIVELEHILQGSTPETLNPGLHAKATRSPLLLMHFPLYRPQAGCSQTPT
jgi:hypothetical protein